jgi:hypothetical protein
MKKSGQFGKRQMAPGKSVSEQSVQFGETVQLPGGATPDRKFTKHYGKDQPVEAGEMLLPGMLNYR